MRPLEIRRLELQPLIVEKTGLLELQLLMLMSEMTCFELQLLMSENTFVKLQQQHREQEASLHPNLVLKSINTF